MACFITNYKQLQFAQALGGVSGMTYFITIDAQLQQNRGWYFPIQTMLLVDFPLFLNYFFDSKITRFKKSSTYPMLWLRRYNSFYVYNILPKVSVISKICSVSGRIYSMIYLIKLWDVSYCILLQRLILLSIQTFEINFVTKLP